MPKNSRRPPEPPLDPGETLALRTTAEIQLLIGEQLSEEQWLKFERSGLNSEELARLMEGDAGSLDSPESVLSTLMSRSDANINALRAAQRTLLAQGRLTADLFVTLYACRHTRPGTVHTVLSAAHVSEMLTALAQLWATRGLPDTRRLQEWSQNLPRLLEFKSLTAAERGMIVTAMEAHLPVLARAEGQMDPYNHAEVLIQLANAGGPEHFSRVWALTEAAEMHEDTRLLNELLKNELFASQLRATAPRLVPLALTYREALLWSSERRDGLHWNSRADLNVDQVAEVMHRSHQESWTGIDELSLQLPADAGENWDGTENADGTNQDREAVLSRVRRWKSPWLARRLITLNTEMYGCGPLIRWLVRSAPLDLLELSLLNNNLRVRLSSAEYLTLQAALKNLRCHAAAERGVEG